MCLFFTYAAKTVELFVTLCCVEVGGTVYVTRYVTRAYFVQSCLWAVPVSVATRG